ncbi:50S ribosomal protein L21, mitochondrial [Prosopis cineraria]|uniref:50S ribosomal protein L21, mitochondrial n=1 Tax=Prosopis cineraria TaxID=364024 RepID=UPI00240EC981|nr:50S ribosomal protein L21, mitochondrial [Prosopis cineraria]
MANRRCLQALTRQASAFLSTNPSLQSLTVPPTLPNPPQNTLTSSFVDILIDTRPVTRCARWSHLCNYSSGTQNHDDNKVNEAEDDGDGDEEEEEEEEGSDDENVPESSGATGKREYTAEEKEAEAAAIGYKVIGPLGKNEQVFKPYEPVFAVIQIGSHQFKVSNGDSIFTERLKFCEVNDKLILNKVLLLGSQSQTIVGRPMLPDAAVHAVVEEHALDAKVIIFKKKRRKNYRRTKGHRQELTKLRITDIQGIEKPENIVAEVPSKAAKKKQEKVAVPA